MSESQSNPYPLRMPAELRAQIDARAKAHNRSLNTELVLLLQMAMDARTISAPGIDVDALAEALAPKLAEQVAAKLKETPTS